jgi:hypothetical protein
VNTISVKIDTILLTDFLLEKDTLASVYDSLIASRWIVETPPQFLQNHPLAPNSALQINYYITSSVADTFLLKEFSWVGYYETSKAGFGFSNDSNSVEIIFKNDIVPVNLVDLSASMDKDKVYLNWITTNEINNYGFEIERAGINSGYKKIGFIEGLNNSGYNSYKFIDTDINGSKKFFYRIKQIDYNGSFKYIGEQVIELSLNSFILRQNYPNPFNSNTVITFILPAEENVRLNIYNIVGELVEELINEKFSAGIHKITFSPEEKITSGVYFYQLRTKDFISTKQFIYLK